MRRTMWILWPAFLAACALELVVFAMIDPLELQWSGHALDWSRQGAYTAAFFGFWVVSLGACALTTVLCLSAAEVNQPTRGDPPA